MNRAWMMLFLLLVLPLAERAGGAEVAAPARQETAGSAEVTAEIQALFEQLESVDFAVREKAIMRLQRLAADESHASLLAQEVHRRLVDAETSLELRKRLEALEAKLPQRSPPPPGDVPPAELDRLVEQLEDESYGARLAAVKRLAWLIQNPKLGGSIYVRLKNRLAQPSISLDTRQWLEPACRRARGIWLQTDPQDWELPAISDAQMAAWLDQLRMKADGKAGPPPNQEQIYREFEDLLARDEYVAKVKQLLRARLDADEFPHEVRMKLENLYDLTRPAMTAEYWQNGRLVSIQHLLVDVPSMPAGAVRPSHFDTIDDRVAHCVSGSNLMPGDYPVGVAIPHPQPISLGAFFHLVNLPTPRRRIAYECQAKTEERERFAALSRKTGELWLAEKRPLDVKRLLVLWTLEAREMSRFVGDYLLAVQDQRLSDEALMELINRPRTNGLTAMPEADLVDEKPSLHGMLCELVALRGTREAAPGLRKAIEAKRVLPATAEGPRRLDWIALLAIASRDPWPGCDAWLAENIERNEELVLGRDQGPGIGATAAAVLLMRSAKKPEDFGLVAAGELLPGLSLAGYRFLSADGAAGVLHWWKQQSSRDRQGSPNGA